MANPIQVLRDRIEIARAVSVNDALDALQQVEALVEAAAEVIADGGVDDIDQRLSYVNVQMSRPTLPALAAALAPFKENP